MQHRLDLTFFIRKCVFFKGTHEGFAVAYFLVSRQESMASQTNMNDKKTICANSHISLLFRSN